MAKLKLELDLFSDWKCVGEDGEYVPGNGTIEDAIIAAAATRLLSIDVPDESEKGYRRTDKVRALLDEKMGEAVEARIFSVSLEALDAQVRETIAKGWQKTNEYGNPLGEPLTLSQLVIDILTKKEDSYQRETRLEKWTRESIEKALKEVFSKEIEKARVAFAAQVDGVLQAKLRDMLASSLGLKA